MNRFRENITPEAEEEEYGEPKLLKQNPEPEKEKQNTSGFFRTLFTEGVVSKEAATEMLPFLLFLAFLAMVYIANSHMAIGNVRSIDKLNKEVSEKSNEYKSLKAELMFKSKMTEVAKIVDTLGIKELVEPPKKIVIAANEY